MENKYTGEIPLKIGNIQGTLVYDWAAISVIKTTCTDKELENLAQMDPAKIAICLAAGFKKHNQEITAEVIMESSPPILEATEAMDRALLFAFHGKEAAAEMLETLDKINEKAKEKVEGIKEQSKKKTK